MSVKSIAEKAIAKMNKKITDEIFLIISKDKDLMYEYLECIEKKGIQATNTRIGKEVKKAYKLDSVGRENNPSCTLIKSHETYR